MNHQEFLEHKPELIELFKIAIYQTLTEMGDDAQGISWFSSKAGEYNEDQKLQNRRTR